MKFPDKTENELHVDLERVMYSEDEVLNRVRELGKQISGDYAGKPLVLISVLKGGIVFLADLMRSITIPHAFDLMGASSYKGATQSSGKVVITKDTEIDLRGKHILLVEFDPEVMAETEGIIMLNDRKIDVREKTSYRSDLAQPL